MKKCGDEMLKLIILDMDGTLFDTTDVNYYSYKEAIAEYGYDVDHDFYRYECNGKHYKDFLPLFATDDAVLMEKIHEKKKELYPKYLGKARLNETLWQIVKKVAGDECKLALVTNASKQNVFDILTTFGIKDDFDYIMTQEDIKKPKPDPQSFVDTIKYFGVKPSETLIFEDSPVGLEAARLSGAEYYQVYNYR